MSSSTSGSDRGDNSGCDPVGCGCLVALVVLIGGLISGRSLLDSLISAAVAGGSTAVFLVGVALALGLLIAVLVGGYMLIRRLLRLLPGQPATARPTVPNFDNRERARPWWVTRPPVEFDAQNLVGVYSRGEGVLIVRRDPSGSYVVQGMALDGSYHERSVFDVWDATKLSTDPDDAIRWRAAASGAIPQQSAVAPNTGTMSMAGIRALWPQSGWGRVVATLLAANCIVLVAYGVVELRLADLLAANSRSSSGEISTLVSFEQEFVQLDQIAFWAAAVGWWAWLYRAARRMRDRGARLTFSPTWSVLTWFIPVVFLVTGYRSVRQLFNEPGMRATWVVPAWWFLFLVGSVVTRSAASAVNAATDIDAALRLVPWEIVGTIATTVSGVLAMSIVAAVDRGPTITLTNPSDSASVADDTSQHQVAAMGAANASSPRMGPTSRRSNGFEPLRHSPPRQVLVIAVVVILLVAVVAAGVTFAQTALRPPSPSSTIAPSTLVERDANSLGLAIHRIGYGESVSSIAAIEHVAATQLIDANSKYYPDIASVTPPIGALLIVPRAATRTVAPTPAPTHPYPVTLRPEEVVMSVNEFPLAGYQISRDMPGNSPARASRWLREFESQTGQYWYASFIVTIYQPDVSAARQIAATQCADIWDWSSSKEQPTISEIPAEAVGDGTKVCRYAFPTISDVVSYTTGTRNLTVTVSVAVRTVGIPQAVATCVALAKQQLTIVDRAAPR